VYVELVPQSIAQQPLPTRAAVRLSDGRVPKNSVDAGDSSAVLGSTQPIVPPADRNAVPSSWMSGTMPRADALCATKNGTMSTTTRAVVVGFSDSNACRRPRHAPCPMPGVLLGFDVPVMQAHVPDAAATSSFIMPSTLLIV